MNSKFLVYTLKRFGMAILTIFLVIAITFFVMHAIPASPFSSEKAKSDAVIKALEAKYGFDKPVGIQFLNYLWNALHFDFGLSTSRVGFTVTTLIMNAFGYSASIGLSAALIAILLGVLLGCIAALNRGKWPDKIIQIVTTALVSVPSFVIATLLLLLFSFKLGWLPSMGGQPGGMILPIVSLSLYPMAYITRLQRSSMLDVLGADYIRTARAKGLTANKVIYKHALKNALSPVITYAGPMMAYILTGSMVVENIFSVPGLGRLFTNSMLTTDYMMIMGVTIFLAAIIILMNFLSDVLYKVMDPRIDLA
ncbi:MAG TPA: ABC transporter permease [Candidatus Limiplasma sp.]|nr:ABC transporter permease [Candidatus Limiplasma sp.]HPS81338.1 ABC transporter permease [Candidatus Limiplasma sp.]